MLYANSEQIFISAMGGRTPLEAEKKEMDSLLGVLKKTGFQPDDPSNAAHVLMLAWAWSHGTSRADVLKLLDEARSDMDNAVSEIKLATQIFREAPPTTPIDLESLAKEFLKHLKLPDRIIVDMGVLKEALKESFSAFWIILAGGLVGTFFWLGTAWEQHHQDTEVSLLKNQIGSQAETIKQCLSGHRK
ncbi:hypothetical protein [Ferrovum myxofaciens]|uniref:hypothetical protein n=1 Tax=Ferrovum myxofaciens TaxID=416213 RepID=UPI003EC0F8FE